MRGPKRLTWRQYTVLLTLRMSNPMDAATIGVRSDVLWRLEEMGYVARSGMLGRHRERWYILPAGRKAGDEMHEALQQGKGQPR